jgi:hypothetical protein
VAKRLYDRASGATDLELAAILRNSGPPMASRPSQGRVLFFSPRFWPAHLAMQFVMGTALRAEGYEVEFVICGEGANFCDMYAAEMAPGGFCKYCKQSCESFLSVAGFPFRRLGDLLDLGAVQTEARTLTESLTLRECSEFEYHGVALGKLCRVSVARSLRRVVFQDDAITIAVYRGFLQNAIANLRASERLLEEDWKLAVVLNSRFTPEAVFYTLARRAGVDVLAYESGFQTNTLFFAVNEDVTQFNVRRQFDEVRSIPLTDAEETRLKAYEAERRVGRRAIVQYFPELDESRNRIVREFGIDTTKHIAVAYPNIVWDSAVFDNERAFASIWAWLEATIVTHAGLSDWELVVRIHPAEIRLPTRTLESMERLIAERFTELPSNVHVIPAAAKASSYVLMEMAERVLVYSSTMGLEAAMHGRDVITAARCHYAELGFTLDARNPEHYAELLRAAPRRVDSEVQALARRYGNFFFYRFHIPVESVDEQVLSRPKFRFASVEELLSGKFADVEFVRHQLFPLKQGCLLMPDGRRES